MTFVAAKPQRQCFLETNPTGLLAVLPYMHDDGSLFFAVCWLGASLFCFVPVRDFTVECFDRMLAIPAKRVDDLVDHRAPTLAIAA